MPTVPPRRRRRYHAILDGLDADPVTFTHPDRFFPVMLRAGIVKKLSFAALYAPVRSFPILAGFLDYLHRRHPERLNPLFPDAPQLMCSLSGSDNMIGLVSD